MTDHYFWEAITILIPIVIGVPISAYISLRIQRKMKKEDTNEIISNMKNAIKQEIEANVLGLKDEDTTTTMDGTVRKGKETLLETPIYDSSVKSGNFILLSSELRKGISELYAYIYLANSHVDLIMESQFTLFTDETKAKFERIEVIQNKHLKKMHDDIVKLSEELLKKL